MELSWLTVWGIEVWVCLALLQGNNTDEGATSSAPYGAKSRRIGTSWETHCEEPGGTLKYPY